MKSLNSPIETVEIRDGDTLEKCNNEQRNIAAEVVEQGEDVIAGTVRENDRQDAAESAQRSFSFIFNCFRRAMSKGRGSGID